MALIFEILLEFIWDIIKWTWWIFLPIWLFIKFNRYWMYYVNLKYLKAVEYKLLELKVPRDLIKTPKSMENIFSTFHAIRAFISSWEKKYWKGETQLWLSLEIMADSEGTHFYIRTPKQFQNLVESQVYAQYPEAEIIEQEDYINDLPKNLPDKNFNLWGTDLMLARESAYPIKTYEYFEEQKEEKRIDPLSSLMEVMSRTTGQDRIWFQILIKYTGDDWKKEAEKVIDDLAGRKKPPKPIGFFSFVSEFFGNFFKAFVAPPEFSFESGGEDSDKPETKVMHLTSGQKDVIKSIEGKISKLGFESFVRFIYISPRDDFDFQNVNGIFGVMNQFNTQDLNSFKPCPKTITGAKSPLKDRKEFLRKRLLYGAYRLRLFNPLTKSVLNTEELATLYHFPIMGVEPSSLKKIGAKKGSPPGNLPVL